MLQQIQEALTLAEQDSDHGAAKWADEEISKNAIPWLKHQAEIITQQSQHLEIAIKALEAIDNMRETMPASFVYCMAFMKAEVIANNSISEIQEVQRDETEA